MVTGKDTKPFRLSPTCGNDPNPTTFTQGAGPFTHIATQLGPVALTINRNEIPLQQLLVMGPQADANAQAPLAKAIRATGEAFYPMERAYLPLGRRDGAVIASPNTMLDIPCHPEGWRFLPRRS